MTREPLPGAASDLDPDGVYSISREVVSAAFDGQIWLHHLNKGRTLLFNATAGIILELMDGERSAAEIRELLQQAYPESAADVGRDVDRTLGLLLNHGALGSPARPAATGQSESR